MIRLFFSARGEKQHFALVFEIVGSLLNHATDSNLYEHMSNRTNQCSILSYKTDITQLHDYFHLSININHT